MKNSQIISAITFGLVIFGLIMIGSASVVDAARDFSDKWYYLKLQSAWAGFGVILFLFTSKFPHKRLQKFASPLLLVTIGLLLVVLIPGIGIKLLGARRWINLGIFSLQPSEVAKLTLGIYFSHLFTYKDRFREFVFILGGVLMLVMIQPDLGTGIVISLVGLITYFGSGGSLPKLFLLTSAGLVLVFILILVSPYRFSRLKTFLDTSHDPQGSSYQIRQALIALGSGGAYGVGLGQSRQKYEYLPESTTDSIFAIIGEELGLLGTLGVVFAFLVICITGIQIAAAAPSGFSSNLALAMTSLVITQAFVNTSSLTALLPLTGIPLAFISYGGSSLLTVLSAMGILVNVAKTYEKK